MPHQSATSSTIGARAGLSNFFARLKPYLILGFVNLSSWPALFGVFRIIQRMCMHAMNRTSAGFLPVTRTGERHAVRRVLRDLGDGDEMLLFDCGANLGEYSDMVIAECAKSATNFTIRMFEPMKHCQDLLNVKYGDRKATVKTHKLAVSSVSGRSRLYFPWPGAGGASQSPETAAIQGNQAFELMSEEIDTVAIDEFCQRQEITTIHLLKLDIEGSELDALIGAREMINSGAIRAIQFELGSAALPRGVTLYHFWKLLSDKFTFHLVLRHGLVKLDEYKADLECFFAGSNFLLLSKVKQRLR